MGSSFFSSAGSFANAGSASAAGSMNIGGGGLASSGFMSGGSLGLTMLKAEGGYITGPGTATSDSIPAMLSNGEYVLKASAVSSIGKDVLDKWNNHTTRPIHRATGGVVGNLSNSASKFSSPQVAVPAQSSVQGDTNIRVVMVDDQRKVGDYINSADGEKTMIEFVRRNSTPLKQLLR
jgi:hypothetical protein